MRSSTATRLLVAAFLGSFVLGCSVMDELDKANAEMHRNDPKPDKTEVAGGGSESGGKSAIALAKEKSAEWWQNTSTFTKGELDDSIVQCRLDGRVQFMRRDDCTTRGGRVG
jgi:hypothetical protein